MEIIVIFSCFLHFIQLSFFQVYGADGRHSEIEISISAANLIQKDFGSKSDPKCLVHVYDDFLEKWEKIFETEVIWNNNNPEFTKKMHIPYKFETSSRMFFELYDIDDRKTERIKKNNFMGMVEESLARITSAKILKLPLKDRNNQSIGGHIILHAEELLPVYDEILLELEGSHLDKNSFWGKPNPFLKIYKKSHKEEWVLVYKSEVKRSKPWSRFQIPVRALCGGDYNRTLKFECRDSNAFGDSTHIGEFTAKLNDFLPDDWSNDGTIVDLLPQHQLSGSKWGDFLPTKSSSKSKIEHQDSYEYSSNDPKARFEFWRKEAEATTNAFAAISQQLDQQWNQQSSVGRTKPRFYFINERKRQSRSTYINSGELTLNFIKVLKNYSFVDYLQGGLRIHCTVAIDFTSSNMGPDVAAPLHLNSASSGAMNLYEQAILSIVPIIQDYNSYRSIAVLGFGAKLNRSHTEANHCFNVNLNSDSPYCEEVNGVLSAYREFITNPNIVMAYPTLMENIIRYQIGLANQSRNDTNSYFILLILTDGVVDDYFQTVDAIIEASNYPISIIIVGIGDAIFSDMHRLDSDEERLQHLDGSAVAQRDIVQFVEFNQFLRGNPKKAGLRLSQEVLAEIPQQVVSYFRMKRIKPNEARDDLVQQYDAGLSSVASSIFDQSVGYPVNNPAYGHEAHGYPATGSSSSVAYGQPAYGQPAAGSSSSTGYGYPTSYSGSYSSSSRRHGY